MEKENFNIDALGSAESSEGEKNKNETSDLETGSEKLEKKAEVVVKKIKEKTKQDQEVETELAKGAEILGAEKIDKERELVVESAIDSIQKIESDHQVVPEKTEFSEEVFTVIEELGLKKEDLEKIKSFTSLSAGAQLLALRNYDQILIDEAVKITPEKLNEIKQARIERYQSKIGKRAGSFAASLKNIFNSGKQQDEAFSKAYEGLKNEETEENKKLALEVAVNWVANFDIPIKLEAGQIKLEFVDPAQFGKEHEDVVKELNEAANRFAKMPQYLSNISASKRDQTKYEKAQLELKSKKENLEASLRFQKNEEELVSVLMRLDNKIANFQNNLTDKEKEEFEKSDSKLVNFLKSKGFEKASYLIGGGAARGVIRRRLTEDATESLSAAGSSAFGLASYATLGVAAAIGGIRGWQRESKKIREKDKKIGKQEYQETAEMRARKEALNELKEATPHFLQFFQTQKDRLAGESWEDYEKRKIEEWLENDPERANIYLSKKDRFNTTNAEFLKSQKNKFLEFNTEANFIYAESSSKKIERLVNEIHNLESRKNLNPEEQKKLLEIVGMLKSRVNYTKNKIDDGLVALGTSKNRLTNSVELFKTLTNAELLLETFEYESKDSSERSSENISDKHVNDDGTINIHSLFTDGSLDEQILYRQERIQGFLQKQDDRVADQRMKQKVKKAAIGAISGAGLAFIGMKAADAFMDSGAGQCLREKMSNIFVYGVDQGEGGSEAVASVFGGSEELMEAIPPVDEIDGVEGGAERISESLSKIISNEGLKPGQTDSVWRSSREIFMNNAESLGYEGDLGDASALRGWADRQVANAINRSGGVTDKVFEGNVVSLDFNEAGKPIINVVAGEGFEPGYLKTNIVEQIQVADVGDQLQEIIIDPNLVNEEASSLEGLVSESEQANSSLIEDIPEDQIIEEVGGEEVLIEEESSLEEVVSEGEQVDPTLVEGIPEGPVVEEAREEEMIRERSSSIIRLEDNILKGNSNNLAKSIHSLANRVSDPETSFLVGGEKTSIKEMLNRVVEVDNFYDRLSSSDKNSLNEHIASIQRVTRLSPVTQNNFYQFIDELVKKYK